MTWTAKTVADRLVDEATPLRLTLLILLLRPPGAGLLRGLTWLVAGLALVVPALTPRAWTWAVLAALVGARLAADWPLADNHIYLLAYWCVGLALSLPQASPFATIASMSRWLVGAAFLCAILWKGVLAPDFLDARFFRMTLITDDRFTGLAQAIGGLTDAQLAENREALMALPEGAELLNGPVLVEPTALRVLGRALTWGGFLLEAAVAGAFLLPHPTVWHAARHALLLAFAVLTYAAAPVAGFGWLLAAMGLAQCRPDQRATRLAYVAVFVLVLVYAETPLIDAALAAMAP